MTSSAQPYPLPMLYKNNLQLAWASATTLTVAAGQARNSDNAFDIISSAITIDAAVSGVNGLDTGSLAASTWYAVLQIASDINTKRPGYLLTTLANFNAGSMAMPLGYSIYDVVGYVLTDGSANILKFYVVGNGNQRQHYWDDAIKVLNDGTSASLANITLTTAVPPIDNTPVFINIEFTPATANDYVSVFPGGSSATIGPRTYGSVAAKMNGGQTKVLSKLVSSAPTIRYINSAAAGNADFWVNGFEYFV
jgi:hypothetical protein